MKCVYVLMYRSNEEFIVDAAKRETVLGKPKPYAVFEDSITAERMKRDGDEVVKVPFICNDCPPVLKADDTPSLNAIPCDKNVTVTYSGTQPWSAEGTLAPFDPPSYPKVTCQKTVDEHKWTDRSD